MNNIQCRLMLIKMEFVMQEMQWDWATLMRCVYGMAKGTDDIPEDWVERWLDRQIDIINYNKSERSKL